MTYAAALSRLTVAMIEVHERTCEIAAPHRWENCTSTPSIFAVADGLDAIEADEPIEVVATWMHNRECQQDGCNVTAVQMGHVRSWRDQARALMIHVRHEVPRSTAPPLLAREGELLRKCQCGHIRRNHSIDAKRCYYTPCDCQADGGFREVTQ